MQRFVESQIRIKATAPVILDALLEPKHLKEWWGVDDAYIEKKDGGLYTLAWLKSPGGIQFVSTGKIKLYNYRSHLELENLMYINAEKPIIGPCSLRYDIEENSNYAILKVKQGGFKKDPVWDWYYDAVADGWPQALVFLKKYLER